MKIVEIAIILFLPYGAGTLLNKYFLHEEEKILETWVSGFAIILGLILILFLISALVLANWQLAGKLVV